MRSFILPATLVLMTAIGSAAIAAPTTTVGMVKSFDARTMTLTLDNGVSYVLPKGFKDPGLKAGEKVSVIWDMKGAVHEASAVTIQKS
ncbi:DUF1344 domain-containing protein [Tabrizicola flagellatus]|uniref:DUF1344 domain-containing protein n=1 Tax=Tabrizicola flagellatus TaxID=2593021 RepID=UPI0011F3F67C|nr:DUF1344 domain-containing protein [Tabrizicola flagellatus]